jgi:hypothetical protein
MALTQKLSTFLQSIAPSQDWYNNADNVLGTLSEGVQDRLYTDWSKFNSIEERRNAINATIRNFQQTAQNQRDADINRKKENTANIITQTRNDMAALFEGVTTLYDNLVDVARVRLNNNELLDFIYNVMAREVNRLSGANKADFESNDPERFIRSINQVLTIAHKLMSYEKPARELAQNSDESMSIGAEFSRFDSTVQKLEMILENSLAELSKNSTYEMPANTFTGDVTTRLIDWIKTNKTILDQPMKNVPATVKNSFMSIMEQLKQNPAALDKQKVLAALTELKQGGQ